MRVGDTVVDADILQPRAFQSAALCVKQPLPCHVTAKAATQQYLGAGKLSDLCPPKQRDASANSLQSVQRDSATVPPHTPSGLPSSSRTLRGKSSRHCAAALHHRRHPPRLPMCPQHHTDKHTGLVASLFFAHYAVGHTKPGVELMPRKLVGKPRTEQP